MDASTLNEPLLIAAIPSKSGSWRRRLVIVSLYLTMLVYGLTENAKIVIYPLIKEHYSLSGTQQGILIAICSYCYTMSTAASTFALSKFGAKATTVIGFSLITGGSIANAFLEGMTAVYLLFGAMDLGFGAIEVSVNAIATGLFQENPARWIALMHFFFGVGSISSPYVSSLMISALKWGYHSVYLAIFCLAMPVLLLLLLTNFKIDGVKSTTDLISVKDCFRNPLLKYFCFCMGFMLLLELGTCDWSVTYFVENYYFDINTKGALFSTLYFLSYTVGRLSVGFVAERIGYFRSLYVLVSLCFALMLTGFLLGEKGFYVLALSGFSIGLHWPILISIGSVYYGDDGPIFTDLFIVSGAIFNTLVEFLIGIINDYVGNAWGYRTLGAAPVILILAIVVLQHKSKRVPYAQSELPLDRKPVIGVAGPQV